MAYEPIDTLIDKEDTFEVVRDQIALILATESVSQVARAIAASKPEPNDWKLRVFTERSNPWEQWLNDQSDKTPLINIWYDNGSFPGAKGNPVERQQHQAVYNIDCYGMGISTDNPAGGHLPGDRKAAFEAQRALRLVRNILMASQNTYLQLNRKTIGATRWPQSITVNQPQIDGNSAIKVIGARLALQVTFNEFSPQYVPETLELLSADVKRTEDGEIVVEADYDYT